MNYPKHGLTNKEHYWVNPSVVATTLNMIFNVTMVIFWMTLLMNKFKNIVMDEG